MRLGEFLWKHENRTLNTYLPIGAQVQLSVQEWEQPQSSDIHCLKQYKSIQETRLYLANELLPDSDPVIIPYKVKNRLFATHRVTVKFYVQNWEQPHSSDVYCLRNIKAFKRSEQLLIIIFEILKSGASQAHLYPYYEGKIWQYGHDRGA